MIFDKDGRLFGKINVIDILIVIVAVAAVSFVLSRSSGSSIAPGATGTDNTYIMKFYVDVIQDFVVEHMQVGDTVMDDGKNINLGTIVDLKVEDSVEFHPDTSGVLVQSPRDGYHSLEITSELTAQSFNNGLIINGNRYAVGQSVTIRAGDSILFLRISGIEEKGAES